MNSSLIGQLEQEARKKHEKTVSAAKQLIESADQTLREELSYIEKLRVTLGDIKPPVNDETLGGKIQAVLPPKNKRFTFDDVFAALVKAYPNEDLNEQSARMVMHRLYADDKKLIRVKKASGTAKSEYVVAGSDVELGPYSDMTAVEGAEAIIRKMGKAMSTAMIAKMLVEGGFESDRTADQIAKSLESTMRKKRGSFAKNLTGWVLLDE